MPGVAESYTIASVGAPEDYREPPRPIAALPPRPGTEELRAAYLSLLKLSLCDLTSVTTREVRWTGDRRPFARELTDEDQLSGRALGKDWALDGMTMIGLRRLDDLQACVESVVDDGIEGDLIEADSFEGFPGPMMRAPMLTAPSRSTSGDRFSCSRPRHRAIVLRPLWRRTRPGLRARVLRGHPGRVATFNPWLPASRVAVDEFRTAHGITTPIEQVDWKGGAGGARTLLSIAPTVPS